MAAAVMDKDLPHAHFSQQFTGVAHGVRVAIQYIHCRSGFPTDFNGCGGKCTASHTQDPVMAADPCQLNFPLNDAAIIQSHQGICLWHMG